MPVQTARSSAWLASRHQPQTHAPGTVPSAGADLFEISEPGETMFPDNNDVTWEHRFFFTLVLILLSILEIGKQMAGQGINSGLAMIYLLPRSLITLLFFCIGLLILQVHSFLMAQRESFAKCAIRNLITVLWLMGSTLTFVWSNGLLPSLAGDYVGYIVSTIFLAGVTILVSLSLFFAKSAECSLDDGNQDYSDGDDKRVAERGYN
jgi:hypothetical protein